MDTYISKEALSPQVRAGSVPFPSIALALMQREYLTTRQLENVEGTYQDNTSSSALWDAYEISQGRVLFNSGVAEHTIHYRAVLWRPCKVETVVFSRPDIIQGDKMLFSPSCFTSTCSLMVMTYLLYPYFLTFLCYCPVKRLLLSPLFPPHLTSRTAPLGSGL